MKTITQENEIATLSSLLKVLAEPKRLEILSLLLQGVQCNCEIGDKLNMAPNLISHHLRVLHKAGLIDTERDPQDARWIYYSINPGKLNETIAEISGFLDITKIQPRSPNCGPQKGKCR